MLVALYTTVVDQYLSVHSKHCAGSFLQYRCLSVPVCLFLQQILCACSLCPLHCRCWPVPVSLSIAHGIRPWRWWPVAVQSWLLPGRFPCHAFHRVQRRSRNLPLLCEQIQLLADHYRKQRAVRHTPLTNAKGWQFKNTGQSMPSLYEGCVIGVS